MTPEALAAARERITALLGEHNAVCETAVVAVAGARNARWVSIMSVDWSRFTQPVSSTCRCRCGVEFRSDGAVDYETLRMVSKDACPGCGKSDAIVAISTDPERQTMG